MHHEFLQLLRDSVRAAAARAPGHRALPESAAGAHHCGECGESHAV